MAKVRKHLVVRALLFASACALAGVLSIAPGQAATDFGVRAGAYADNATDDDNPFLGAEALFGVGSSKQWFGNPNLEHTFADAGDTTTFSMDFHYDFPSGRPYSWWAGAGPTVIHREVNDTTDPGVNLLVGVGAKKGDVRPYGQFKVIAADDSAAVLGVGVRF